MTDTQFDFSAHLLFRDAYITETSSSVNENADPKYLSGLEALELQTAMHVANIETVTIDGVPNTVLRVYINYGARWLSDEVVYFDDDETIPVEKNENGRIINAVIEAKFIAEYILTEMVSEEEISVFSRDYVPLEIWPYWREYLGSQCTRMHLNGVKMPTAKVGNPV